MAPHVVPPRRRASPTRRTVATSTSPYRSPYRSTKTVETRVTTVQCACRHTDGQWHRTVTHTSCSHTHGQWLSHTSCLSVLFISIHRDATSLRLSASSDRKSATSHMLRCCLRWTDRSAAALRTCFPFSAPAESCERVPATVVLQPFAACRSSHMLPAEVPLGAASPRTGRTPGPASHRMPHALRYRLHNRLAAACSPPPARRRRRLHAACTSPARRLRRLRPGATHAGVISLRPSWRVWRGVYLPGPGASDCGFLRKRGAVDLSLPEWPELVAKAP